MSDNVIHFNSGFNYFIDVLTPARNWPAGSWSGEAGLMRLIFAKELDNIKSDPEQQNIFSNENQLSRI